MCNNEWIMSFFLSSGYDSNGIGISNVKQWDYKARCHMITSFSNSNPGSGYIINPRPYGSLNGHHVNTVWEVQVEVPGKQAHRGELWTDAREWESWGNKCHSTCGNVCIITSSMLPTSLDLKIFYLWLRTQVAIHRNKKGRKKWWNPRDIIGENP